MDELSPIANRGDELKLIRQQIKAAGNETAVAQITNICGVPGIGKSRLLHEIAANSRDSRSTILLYINLDRIDRRDLFGAKLQFLDALVEQEAGPQLAGPLQLLAEADRSTDRALDQAIASFAQALVALPEVIVFIADTWDKVPETLFAWVEYFLLLTLATRHKRVVCVLGSQSPLRWRQYEVRRRVKVAHLQALSPAHSAEQLGDFKDLAESINDLTAGHPRSNVLVQKLLREKRDSANWFANHKGEVARKLIDALADEVADDDEDLPVLIAVFRVAAVLREFDLHSLRDLLPELLPADERPSQSLLMLMVRELAAKHIATWSERTRSYQLAPALRHIFARELQLNHEELYIRLRDQAVEYYKRLVEDVSGNRDQFLVELIYQRLYKEDWPPYNKLTPIYNLFVDALSKHYGDQREAIKANSQHLRGLLEADSGLQDALQFRNIPRTYLVDLLDDPPLKSELN